MPEGERDQSPTGGTTLASWALLLAFAVILSRPFVVVTSPAGNDVSAQPIKDSATVAAFLWCLGWPVVLARRGETAAGLRLLWTLGCLLALAHMAVAFHLGHAWSHSAAWEHTRQVAGYGDGIYVNYLFALVWLADVVWAWAAFDSYRSRPRWLNWAVHGFLAFVVFNAAVVFASSPSRSIAFALALLISLGLARLVRRIERKAEERLGEPSGGSAESPANAESEPHHRP
jgi:hypothetical protein